MHVTSNFWWPFNQSPNLMMFLIPFWVLIWICLVLVYKRVSTIWIWMSKGSQEESRYHDLRQSEINCYNPSDINSKCTFLLIKGKNDHGLKTKMITSSSLFNALDLKSGQQLLKIYQVLIILGRSYRKTVSRKVAQSLESWH